MFPPPLYDASLELSFTTCLIQDTTMISNQTTENKTSAKSRSFKANNAL